MTLLKTRFATLKLGKRLRFWDRLSSVEIGLSNY